MDCQCSGCYSLAKKWRAESTIEKHLRKDLTLLNSYNHHPISHAFLLRCIEGNREILQKLKAERNQARVKAKRAQGDAMDIDDTGGPLSFLDANSQAAMNYDQDMPHNAASVADSNVQDVDYGVGEFYKGVPLSDLSFPDLGGVEDEVLPDDIDPYYQDPEAFDEPLIEEADSDFVYDSDNESYQSNDIDDGTQSHGAYSASPTPNDSDSDSGDRSSDSEGDEDDSSDTESDSDEEIEVQAQFSMPASC